MKNITSLFATFLLMLMGLGLQGQDAQANNDSICSTAAAFQLNVLLNDVYSQPAFVVELSNDSDLCIRLGEDGNVVLIDPSCCG